ncbi:uncharacterized protein LOC144431911 isoform X2 [Styela clava]
MVISYCSVGCTYSIDNEMDLQLYSTDFKRSGTSRSVDIIYRLSAELLGVKSRSHLTCVSLFADSTSLMIWVRPWNRWMAKYKLQKDHSGTRPQLA